MQSHSLSVDTLKDNLLRAIDAEYNVIKADIVLDIICQLEQMEITKDQLQTTRLGWEINTIRQKIDARKKNVQSTEKCSQLIIEIAQRAKKLLRSWQGLLNTSSINVDTKPRLILKVKFNSSLTKRKRDSDSNKTNVKRKKTQVIETPISPVLLTEINSSLPRLKTTQQLLLEMQMNEPNVLATQTSTVNAILHKKIIDESLHETIKLDYSALHHGRDLNNTNANSTHYQKQLPSPNNTIVSARTYSNWENGSSAGSPISPLSSSSSSSISWPISTPIPDSPLTVSVVPESKPSGNCSDLTTICASFHTVADLIEDHRRRILSEHDSRELEARPDLLLVPIDQLAFVYEREKLNQLNLPSHPQHSSITTIEKLNQPFELFALPYIDCPMEFDLVLDELVVQHSSINM